MTPEPSAAETAARIRAARGYAGMSAKDLAAALNLSVETWSRTENGRRPADAREVQLVVRLCGVPMAFMERGFSAIEEAEALTERVSRLERTLDEQRAAATDYAQEVQRRFDDIQRTMARPQSQRRP